jgi:hypothetical protein
VESLRFTERKKVIEDVADLIADSTAATPKAIIIEMVKSSAFEHIMERYPKPGVLNEIIADAYRPTIPNPVHETIAELINDGIVKHVITTNYDEGIENACASICRQSGMPFVVTYQSDVRPSVSAAKPVLFKIHGSAKAGQEDSIVATLTTEGELPEWKQTLLDPTFIPEK